MEGGKRAGARERERTHVRSLTQCRALSLEMAKQKVNRKLKTETEKQSAKLWKSIWKMNPKRERLKQHAIRDEKKKSQTKQNERQTWNWFGYGSAGRAKGKQREVEEERGRWRKRRGRENSASSLFPLLFFIVSFHANKLFNSTVWQLKANYKAKQRQRQDKCSE